MNSVDAYFKEISRYPLLTGAEEIELGKQVQEMLRLQKLERRLTPPERKRIKAGEKARERMIKSNLRMVVHLAKKNLMRGLHFHDLMDMVQEGTFGLMRAVELFDPERGYKFSTYAYWWIRQSIGRGIQNNEFAIHRSVKVVELEFKLRRLVIELSGKLGRNPTTAELAEAANTTVAEIDTIRMRGGHCLSLDVRLAGSEGEASELMSLISYEDDELEENPLDVQYVLDRVMPVLHVLDERERTAVTLRYGLCSGKETTLAEIGKRLGISRESTRKMLQRGLRKMMIALRKQGTFDDLRSLAECA